MYGLRGPRGLTAMSQLIYELRKNCRATGRVDGWTSKVLQEVLADLKTFKFPVSGPNVPESKDEEEILKKGDRIVSGGRAGGVRVEEDFGVRVDIEEQEGMKSESEVGEGLFDLAI